MADREYVRVAEEILQEIEGGRFKTGALLPPDRQLAESMGVSRPTVREALVALEVAGLVASTRGAGVRVQASRHTVIPVDNPAVLARPRELIEARMCMEPAVAAVAAERATEDGIAELRAETEEFAAAMGGRHMSSKFARSGLAFHTSLAALSGNSILATAIDNLTAYERHPLWVLLNQSVLRSSAARSQQVTEHREIVAAIECRDGRRAYQLVYDHLQRLRDRILPAAEILDSSSNGALLR